jgi:hypothetical protein
MKRTWRRLLAVLTLALVCTVLTGFALPGAASAAPFTGDCDTPVPEVPGRGVVGFFEPKPDKIPAVENPFNDSSKTSIMEQYGYAGLRFNTYGLDCSTLGLGSLKNSDATVSTTVANWIMTFPKAAVAGTSSLLRAAYSPDFLSVFDPLISNVVDTLRRTFYEKWAFLVIAAIGLMIIWRARHAPLATSTSAIGWALLVMMIATILFRWPVAAGKAADSTVKTTLSSVVGALNGTTSSDSADPGGQAASNLHRSLLYTAWLGGTFGDTNSEVAKQYGPKIFDGQALTWAERESLRTSQHREEDAKTLQDKKTKEFSDAAAAVKDKDSDAFEYLRGTRSDARIGYAVLAVISTLCALPFLIISGLLVIGALVIVRFGVMLFPIFATLGMFPTMRSLVTGIANTVASALVNAVIFGIGSALMVRSMGVVLDPSSGLAGWLQIVLVLLLTIVMWVMLAPFRRLTHMVSPRGSAFAGAGFGLLGRGVGRTGRMTTGSFGAMLGGTAALEFARRKAAGDVETGAGLALPVGAASGTSRAEAEPPSWAEPVTEPFPGRRTAGGGVTPERLVVPVGGAYPPDDGFTPSERGISGPSKPGGSSRREAEEESFVAVAGSGEYGGAPRDPDTDVRRAETTSASGATRSETSGRADRPRWVDDPPVETARGTTETPRLEEDQSHLVYRPPSPMDEPVIDLTDPTRGAARDVEAAGVGSDATFRVPERG